MGSEDSGISTEYLKRADEKVIIPMNNVVQSLNVSVAAGIILLKHSGSETTKIQLTKSFTFINNFNLKTPAAICGNHICKLFYLHQYKMVEYIDSRH